VRRLRTGTSTRCGATVPDRPPRRTHRCPCGCGTNVPQHLYACREGWLRLPGDIRAAIWKGYRRNDAAGHMAAMLEAAQWYYDNPLETLL
jgi:hypothetical protein